MCSVLVSVSCVWCTECGIWYDIWCVLLWLVCAVCAVCALVCGVWSLVGVCGMVCSGCVCGVCFNVDCVILYEI